MGLDLTQEDLVEIEDAVVILERVADEKTGWLANIKLNDPDAQYDLERKFVNPSKKEEDEEGNGTRTFHLDDMGDGFFEAKSTIVGNGGGTRVLYMKVEGGDIVETWGSKKDAKAAMEGAPGATAEPEEPEDELDRLYAKKMKLLDELADINNRIEELEV